MRLLLLELTIPMPLYVCAVKLHHQEAEAARKQVETEAEAADDDSGAFLRPQKKKKANNKQGKLLLRELRTLVEAQDAE